MRVQVLRLAGYLLAVVVAYLLGDAHAGWLFGVACAASVGVLGAVVLLLSLEGIGEGLGLVPPWSEGLDVVEDNEGAVPTRR